MPARDPAPQRLQFKEKLIQSGKGGGTDALLKRLKTLHVELKDIDQENIEVKSVDKVTKQLIDTSILHHKDRGVKAFAACCLADVLRIYAPDAPYSADELRDIFQFFIVQITSNLKLSPNTTRPLAPSKRGNDSSSQSTLTSNSRITEIPYYTEYCYLIDSLANIRSVVLIVDLPGAEDLITTYFEGFIDCVRADMNKQLVRNLSSVLVEIINETDVFPSGVMECILHQFEAYASKPDTPSFQMITDVCNRAGTKLQRPTFAHFSEIQLSHGRDPSPSDLKTLTESHEVILTIFRHAPNLLLNVVPLLEENLRAADETPLRQLTTQTLGTMFGERPVVKAGVVDLARAYPATWRAWLGRRLDKAVSVRVVWIEAARDILVSHPELRKELEPCLVERIQDSDERVRAAICKVVGSVDYETALHHISEELMRAIGQRMSDKKASVRSEAVTALAKLWSLAQSQIEANDEDAVAKFEWIPQEMLHAIQRAVGAEAKTQISIAFKTHILPLPTGPDDDQDWVDRFLLVASRLDDSATKTLDKLTGIFGYARGTSPYGAFVQMCMKYNGGGVQENEKQIKGNLDFVIDAIAHTLFGDADKARKDLERFSTINEPRLYKLFKALVDPQTGLRETIKARNELLRRIEQSHTSILETFSVVIDAAAWMIINQSSIPGLIKRIQKPEGNDPERTAQAAAHYLTLIAKHCAPMFKSHVPALVIIINDKRNDLLVQIGFQALAAVCKWEADCAPTVRGVNERAKTLALRGTPRQAKFAARFLVYCKDPKAALNLVELIWEELSEAEDDQLLPLLHAASELALSAPQHFKNKGKEITTFVLNDLMMRPSPSVAEMDDKWVDEEELELQDRAKIIGMSVLTHQCLGWARSQDAVDLADPTLKFLAQILNPQHEGMITQDTQEGGRARVHLRLRAALCLIKLARVRAFDKAMTVYFGTIALMMQDPIFTVRQRMLQKLAKVLPPQRMMPRWNLLPILTAIDPESENRAAARQIMGLAIRGTSQLRPEDRIDRVEMPLARLLHLLALHPDLDWQDDDSLKDIAKFIELFVECVARRDNVALLFTIANKLKTVSVSEDHIDREDRATIALLTSPNKKEGDDVDMEEKPHKELYTINLYKMSEMAQIILRTRAHHHQWPMSVYPGKIKLPADIFDNLPTPQIAQIVSRKTFLPDGAEWTKNLGKHSRSSAPGQGRRTAAASSPRARKRKSTASGAKAAPRKKRRSSGRSAAVSDTESEIEDSSDEDSDDDDDNDDDEEEEESAASENDDGNLRRGGQRSAKTKAKKAVKKKRKAKSPTKKSPTKKPAVDASSDLSDLSDA